jgi:hypothetical protein
MQALSQITFPALRSLTNKNLAAKPGSRAGALTRINYTTVYTDLMLMLMCMLLVTLIINRVSQASGIHNSDIIRPQGNSSTLSKTGICMSQSSPSPGTLPTTHLAFHLVLSLISATWHSAM